MHHWGRYKGSIECLFKEANSPGARTHTYIDTLLSEYCCSLWFVSRDACLYSPVFPSLSLRQGHGEAQKRMWYQNDSAVCLSLNMHKWIIGESKCTHGCIKHFCEHLRWKLLLGVVFLAPPLFWCYVWVKMGFQKPEDSACSVSIAQPNTVMDQEAANANQLKLELCLWSFSTHSNRSWPVLKLVKAVFHNVNCTVCWHLTSSLLCIRWGNHLVHSRPHFYVMRLIFGNILISWPILLLLSLWRCSAHLGHTVVVLLLAWPGVSLCVCVLPLFYLAGDWHHAVTVFTLL